MHAATGLPLHMRRDGLGPAQELARVRDGDGVARVTTPFGLSAYAVGVDAYVVCRYEDVRQVLSDPARFSSARLPAGPSLIGLDPPEHTRLRRMLTPEFTERRMRRLEPRIAEIVDAALDDLERAGPPADLVAGFARSVPSLVICELLGVPYEDRAAFQDHAARLLDISLSPQDAIAAQRDDREYMASVVTRAQADPGEDLLGMLVREHGDDLSTAELTGLASLLLRAGHETTSSMLGLGTLALLRHPDQLASIRDDPARIEPAIEELLRWLSIVHSLPPRMTTAPVELAGHVIPAGSIVLASLPAANRDPAFTANPDALDITRTAEGHVAFGHGVHHCLGAPLARMEMRIAFPALLRRFPGLALADPDAPPDFRVSTVVFGLKSLSVTW